jgi:hypothetical protein
MGFPFFAEDDDRDEGEAGDEADGVCFFSVVAAAAEDEGGALAAPLPRSCLGSAREAEVW